MDQRSDQIVEHIEHERHNLGRNLDELQNRIRSTTVWRAQFERHPMAMLGLAMGGGMLIGAVVSGGRQYGSSSRNSRSYARSSYSDLSRSSAISGSGASTPMSSSSPSYGSSGSSSPSYSSSLGYSSSSLGSGYDQQRGKAGEIFENIKGALLGYAVAQGREWLNQLLPGFSQHYDESARQNQSRSFSSSGRSSQSSGYGSQSGSQAASDYGDSRRYSENYGATSSSSRPSGSHTTSGQQQTGSSRQDPSSPAL